MDREELTTSGSFKLLGFRSEDLMNKHEGKTNPTMSTKTLIPHDMHPLRERGA